MSSFNTIDKEGVRFREVVIAHGFCVGNIYFRKRDLYLFTYITPAESQTIYTAYFITGVSSAQSATWKSSLKRSVKHVGLFDAFLFRDDVHAHLSFRQLIFILVLEALLHECCRFISTLMTCCFLQTQSRSISQSSRHGRLAWKIDDSLQTWTKPSSWSLMLAIISLKKWQVQLCCLL